MSSPDTQPTSTPLPPEEQPNNNENNGSTIDSDNTVATETWFTTIAGVMGNVLEWYDFALFGFFSDIIAKVFFPPAPEDDEHANLVRSFCVFGGAFVMRPIGGMIIGYIGDVHGRKTALTRSLFLMAIPTTLMGCLPTYDQAGSLAIVLLVFCRLLQGLSVGGQLPASLVYTLEKRHRSEWGFYGSFPMVAANFGSLLGNLCGAFLRQILSEQQLLDWGWRVPFFSGFIIVFVACYLKKHGAELHTTAGVYDDPSSKIKHPIRVAFARGNRLALLSTSLTPMLWASGFYVSFIWMAIYMEELLDPPVKGAFWINAATMCLTTTLMLPVAGAISDRTGRTKLMAAASLGLTVAGPILFIIISKGKPVLAFVAQLGLGIMLSFFGGPLWAWIVEHFSPEARLTSASLGYDFAHAVVGGFSPAMATALFRKVGPRAPGLIYTVFGTVSLIGLLITYCSGGNQKEQNSAAGDELELKQSHDAEAKKDSLPEIT